MTITIRAFSLPKAGNCESEYEDAAWPCNASEGTSFPVRMAVADGATEASFSAFWARLLVQDYGEGLLTEETLPDRLMVLRDSWKESVGKEPLPWYAEEKLRSGAFSSLLGLTIERDPEVHRDGGRWTALAIGDSCLFHVRGGELLLAFPLARTSDFDSRPVLIPSVRGGDEGLEGAMRAAGGRWREGDVFYLMTDAFACWFLRRLELREGDPIGFVEGIQDDSSFEEVIRHQRGDRTEDGLVMLKNDDVTLIRCRLGAPDEG
ncbi:MAG: hypothetical protein BGO49_17290 [Planctomycetales bacterium 71-10]|nr:MAG: hypothetical protein BGO49_17290 [Planctomycetales bacterium 71-10]